MVRRTRGPASSNGSSRPASSAQARCGASGPVSASARDTPASRRSPRIADSAAADAPSTGSWPPGGKPGRRAVGRRKRGEVPVEPRGVPAADGAVERVRPGPDRLVRPPHPVREVVPALASGPSPVRDLVAPEAGRTQPLHRQPVLRGRPIVVLLVDRCRPPAPRTRARRQVVAHRARQALGVRVVERQGIGGDVIRLEGERRIQRRGPNGLGLPGHVVQEVERHGRDARLASRVDGGSDVVRPVPPAQPPEQARIERLRAHRQAVDPGRDEGAGIPALVGPRVGLDRDLRAVGEPETLARERHEAGDGRRRQQGRRPAADVQGVEGEPPRPEGRVERIRPQPDLRQQGVRERRHARPRPARGGTRVDDEVAVRAQRDAERDVDVERNRRVARRSRRSRAPGTPC